MAVLELSSYEMMKHTHRNGSQCVLDFGRYHLSIIDDGYGSEQGLYEIGVFAAADGIASGLTELPGITAEGDSVRGRLSEADVGAVIKKMYLITGKTPVQV